MTKLRVLDLFSGIGGFSLGLERAKHKGEINGFETVAFCEIEEFPRKVLAKHWPGITCYRDVRELTADRLTADGIAVDVVCGGFPCQDISYAGLGAGLAGKRSGLFYEVSRLVGELGPRFVILENVGALLSRGLDEVLGTLAEIGYDAEWHCIPASYLGAWHRRDRVWILAYPNKERCEGRAKEPLFSQRGISRELVRGFERYPGRSNLPASRLCNANDGISRRVDRLAALGNAVVPQIPELIGNAILEAINQ